MDRPLPKTVILEQVRKKRLQWIIGFGVALAVIFVVTRSLSPSVERVKVRTAQVEVGEVEAVLTASGTVVPEYEQVITSPIETRVLKVLKHAGDTIPAQESILILDNSIALASFEKRQDQVALKVNVIEQSKAELSGRVAKLKAQFISLRGCARSIQATWRQELRPFKLCATSNFATTTSQILMS